MRRPISGGFAVDRNGTVVTGDGLVMLVLVALSLVMLVVFFYYALRLLGGLPDIYPRELPIP